MSERYELTLTESQRRALLGNDLLAAQALLGDSSVLHMAGGSGLAGQYQGKEAILGLYAQMAQLTDGTLHFTPSRVLSETDQSIVVCGCETATRRDQQLDSEAILVFSLRGGIVREMWILHEDQGRVDSFWGA